MAHQHHTASADKARRRGTQFWLQNPGTFSQSLLRFCWVAAAAAPGKLLQSCPTLCDPIDGSPPGSPIPGILQARTLEWVAISFSNAWKWKVQVKSLSRVQLFVTPWTAAHQAPPSMRFPRQEYWSGVPLWFSNWWARKLLRGHIQTLVASSYPQSFWFSRSGWGLRIYVFDNFPGDADVAGPETTIWKTLLYHLDVISLIGICLKLRMMLRYASRNWTLFYKICIFVLVAKVSYPVMWTGKDPLIQFSSVQSLSPVRLFATP